MSTPYTGKDVALNLTIDGVLVEECSAITMSEKLNFTKTKSQPIGCDITYVNQDFESWTGTITFNPLDGRVQALIDAYTVAIRNRIPVEINITRTINYVDSPSLTHVYRRVALDYEGSFTRGEPGNVTINWESGLDRI